MNLFFMNAISLSIIYTQMYVCDLISLLFVYFNNFFILKSVILPQYAQKSKKIITLILCNWTQQTCTFQVKFKIGLKHHGYCISITK